jgi:EmrB/QacA subfamily drug resistance transporter
MATIPAIRERGSTTLTFSVLALSVWAFVLLQSLTVPVLTTIQAELHTDQQTVTWVLTAYLLSASICTPLLGRVGDVVGKTRMLVLCLVLLSIGSLMAALAPSVGWMILARVVQGAGGGVLPLSFGIIRDEFGAKMNGALSVLASLTAVGFGAGIVVAGPIVDHLGYHWLFLIPMIATVIAAVTAFFAVPESPVRTPARLPVLPAVLLAAFLVTLLLGLSWGNEHGWLSARVLGMFAAAAVAGWAWITTELRVPVPMIDMRLMRRRGMWTANVVAGAMGFATFAAFGFIPQLLQTPTEAGYGFGASITESGYLLLPSAAASFVVGFTTARLIAWMGARVVIGSGLMLAGVSFLSIAFFHQETWQLYAATTVQGIGSGLVFSSLAGVVIAAVPAEQTGVASGMNANIRTIGGSLGTAVMAGIVTAHVGSSGFPLERGYTVGFTVMGVVMILATFAAAKIPDLRLQPTSGHLADAENAELGFIPGAGAVGSR